ncbi:MAG TPA: cyclic nucleotide-binding domain-containing protein [Acidimicrobiales bacterium]|nr:cyclic nucleotide-binding domain-containing protein [Acidimicrobiales bacterium]
MSFLGELHEHDQRALRAAGQWQRWRAGATIFREGNPSDTVLVIEIGQVKLVRTHEQGGEELLAVVGKGDLLGELAAIDGKPRMATACAIDDVEAFVIPADAFRTAMVRQPALGAALLSSASQRLRSARWDPLEVSVPDTQRRLARRTV